MISKREYLLYMLKALIVLNANRLGWKIISISKSSVRIRKKYTSLNQKEFNQIGEQILRTPTE